VHQSHKGTLIRKAAHGTGHTASKKVTKARRSPGQVSLAAKEGTAGTKKVHKVKVHAGAASAVATKRSTHRASHAKKSAQPLDAAEVWCWLGSNMILVYPGVVLVWFSGGSSLVGRGFQEALFMISVSTAVVTWSMESVKGWHDFCEPRGWLTCLCVHVCVCVGGGGHKGSSGSNSPSTAGRYCPTLIGPWQYELLEGRLLQVDTFTTIMQGQDIKAILQCTVHTQCFNMCVCRCKRPYPGVRSPH
jgi:hypothetical protein